MKRFIALLSVITSLALPLAGTTPNRPAPALVFKDLAGQDVSLAALKGKVVVVDFWATWCGPCLTEIPGYIALQKKYGAAGLVIIGVSLDQAGPRVVKKFVQDNGVNYTVVMGDTEAIDAFQGDQAGEILLPTTYLIDRTGRIVHQKKGAMDHAAYEAIVQQAL